MIAFLEAKRAGLFGKGHWFNNIAAGVVVGIVALPLAMAFAIASGAKPEQGIYTSIVAGLLTTVLGGSRLQIAGPTGAFIVILSGITAKYGMGGLQMATLMAGIMLAAMGFSRLGGVIKYIPTPVIVGFTAGIGVIIFVGQWDSFLGLQNVAGGEHFHEKVWHLMQAAPRFHHATAGIAILSLALLIITPKLLKKVPAPFVVMVVAAGLQAIFKFDGVATIESAFGGIPQSLPSFQWPAVTFTDVLKLIGPAFTIALLGAIESLLSAVVADGMAGTRHDSDQELIGQGIANVFAPLLGGFASTGAIARTATSIKSGGTSPLAGIVHVLTLVLIILLLAPLASYIPLCALSAILFVVAYNMSEVKHAAHLLKTAPRADMAILLITFFLTVFSDLVIAVNVGVVLAALLFMRRMSHAVQVDEHTHEDVKARYIAEKLVLPKNTALYSINGPFFFGVAEKLERTLSNIQRHPDTVVINMAKVPFTDSTGLQALEEMVNNFRKHRTRVVLCGVQSNVAKKLERAGIMNKVGKENMFPSVADFIKAPQP